MADLLAGRLGLTEWAELEAHTAACETCDRALDYRYRDLFEERIGRERPVASRAGRTARRVGIGAAAVLALGAIGVYASPRLLPEISSTLREVHLREPAGDFVDSLTASLSRVASTSLSRMASMLAPSPTRPDQDPRIATGPPVPSAPPPPARPAEEASPVSPLPTESMPTPSPAGPAEEARTASPPSAESMAAPTRRAEEARTASPPPAESMPASAPTRRTEEARTVSPPVPPPTRHTEDAPAASAPPRAAASATTPAATAPPAAPSPPAVTARPPTSASLPPRSAAPRRPARASEPKPEQKATAQKPVKGRSVAQSTRVPDEQSPAATPRPFTGAAADVIAQLSVQDRQEARRDIGLLLARLGGSRKAERESTVWLEVPRSRYSEFTRGLAQIGAWQMEQGGQPLPDPVAVTVILTR
jgi:hypothetical protein